MTNDTDYPKERVEEREHDVFVPPDEQHMGEDGEPTEPAERAEVDTDQHDTDQHDADRVEAVGTESVPHPRNMNDVEAETEETDREPDTEPTLVDPQPATPLDTGTAEDAERAEEMDADRADADRHDDVLVAAEERHPDLDGFADDVAVGTAPVPKQSTASTADFWPSGLVDDLRGRWDTIQMRFVDDPSGVAADAKALVGEAVSAIRDAVDRLEARLEEAAAEATDNTEELRKRVAHLRDVLESLLSR